MSLGDFIGSLQFYPWKERMLMPEEEPIERVRTEATKTDVSPAVPSPGENHMKGRRSSRRTARQNGRRRNLKPEGGAAS